MSAGIQKYSGRISSYMMWRNHIIKSIKEENMMKTQSKKSSRAIKKAFAGVLSFALAMSTLAVAPNADAAKKKVPKLSTKKKTLYFNKAGKNSFTLKE